LHNFRADFAFAKTFFKKYFYDRCSFYGRRKTFADNCFNDGEKTSQYQ